MASPKKTTKKASKSIRKKASKTGKKSTSLKKSTKKTASASRKRATATKKKAARAKNSKKSSGTKGAAQKTSSKSTRKAVAVRRASAKKAGRNSKPPRKNGSRRESKGFLDEMAQILLAKRQQLAQRISRKISEHENLTSHRTHDTTDAAADAVDKELALLVAEAETKERAKVDEALEKVAEGSYGRCEGCSKLIPLARLKVLPFASLCIQCKELEEKNGPGYFENIQ